MTKTTCSRREILKGAGAAIVSAAAGPYIVPSSAWGANDRVGVGYIGVGRRAQQLMGLPKDMQIVAVSDVFRERVDEISAAKQCKGYLDYREMLASPEVDAVVVATPDHWHAINCIHACQAGKDVYCEKPMTLTVREGRAMVDAVRQYGRVLQVGSQQRSMAECRLGCELVRNGRAGKIHTVHGNKYPSPWECDLPEQPVPEGLNWDMWCGQTEPRPYHIDLYLPRADGRKDAQGRPLGWISFRPYSGGEMTGWGAHGLDIVQWALGCDESGPVEVWPEGEGLTCEVCFRYANGVVLKLDDKGPAGGGLFEGDAGEIRIDRGKCETKPKDLAKEPLRNGDVRLYKSDDHMQNWLDCIRSREKPVADVEIGHRSTTVCHLGNIARWTGRKLRWDPEKETFVNDDDANTYLQRPMRAPWTLE